MKYILLLSIFLISCGTSARRTFFGSWKESPKITVYQSQPQGIFTIVQHQSYWNDSLDSAEMELQYTNMTQSTISFNFQINFQLNTVNTDNKYKLQHGTVYNGYWTYQNAVVNLRPSETISFGTISNRPVSIKDGIISINKL